MKLHEYFDEDLPLNLVGGHLKNLSVTNIKFVIDYVRLDDVMHDAIWLYHENQHIGSIFFPVRTAYICKEQKL